MVDDRIEGAAKTGFGRVQDAFGGLTGDAGTQARGKLNQAAGAVQDATGKARESAEDLYGEVESYVREQPLAALAVTLAVGLAFGFLLRGGKTVYVRK
jgi:uncharacterized protein YjbJ (UPF0337 family)